MFDGIDPKKMQAMMRQMGIQQDEVDATRVIIEKADGSRIVIENPSVARVSMKGQESWQISGEAHEESGGGVNEEDVRLIMEKTGKDYGVCKDALIKNEGDIAKCILDLSGE